jgi:hypothetical protein
MAMDGSRKDSRWQKASVQSEGDHALQQKFLLVLAGLWLQVVVLIFVVIEIQSTTHTPVRDWVKRIILLLSTA